MKKLLLPIFVSLSFGMIAQNSDLDRTWFLTSLEINGEDIPIPPDTYPTLSIDSEGGIYEGIGGCNSYAGTMDVASLTELTILDLSYTLVMCESTEQEDFEGQYFQFLGNGVVQDFQYETFIDGGTLIYDTLTLIKPNGDTAIYGTLNPVIPENITTENWFLDYFEKNGVAQNYPPTQPQQNRINIESAFETSETSHGFLCITGGYTDYTAYNYFGEQIMNFGGTATLADDCGEDISVAYDRDYYEQLELKKHTYEIIEEGQGRRMILTDENGDRIFYENAFLSTNDIQEEVSVQLFPNPAENVLTIEGAENININSVTIYNMSGQLINQQDFSDRIDISQLKSGLYFLKLNTENQFQTLKFIKK